MKKQLVIIGIIAILVCVGLSGCDKIINPLSSDGTSYAKWVTKGDIGQIKIVDYQFYKWQHITLNITSDALGTTGQHTEDASWDCDISNIMTNYTKRKYVVNTEISEIYNAKWNSNYTGYSTGIYSYTVNGFSLDHYASAVIVTGTAKNIGNDFLNMPKITVNYYNKEGVWLASETDIEDNIPSGYTWDFIIYYKGEFRNDVDYISFEVKT
jgi:hypothetical protein